MVGARAKGDPQGWENALYRLRHADLEKIQQQFPDYPYPDLLKAIQVSVDALETDQLRQRYLEFAVFPEDTAIPEAVLQMFWAPMGMDKYDLRDVMKRFLDLSLMQRDKKNCLTLHDVQYDFARRQIGAKALAPLHERLINAYRSQCEDGWHAGPRDGYYFEYLPWHLGEAGKFDELYQLLHAFDWLQAKLEATDVNALIADYDYLANVKHRSQGDRSKRGRIAQLAAEFLAPLGILHPWPSERFAAKADLRTVQSVLRQSADILARNPKELPGQLIGRLPGNSSQEIERLRGQASEYKGFPWIRPSALSLTPLDTSLIRTLQGHTHAVTAVALSSDGRRAVSGSDDNTLRVWDLESGQMLRALQGHSFSVTAVALSSDGRRAVSGSDDETLRVWDLESGQTLRTLQGHTRSVTAVALSSDGRRAVSGSDDETMRVWDLESGRTLRTLQRHSEKINAVALSSDRRRAVSGSDDKTLRVWDLESGQTLRTLQGHTEKVTLRTVQGHALPVTAVALSSDGRRAVSGSHDRTLRVWDLKSGQTLRTLQGHTHFVNAVALSSDGRRAVSGSDDRTLRVWDLKDGRELVTFTIDGIVKACALANDNRTIVAGDSFGRVHFLRLEGLG